MTGVCMNLRRFLVPSSETGCIKKRTAKKLISVVLTSLAILSAVLDTAGDLPSTPTTEAQAGVVSIPLGLTRSRGAFRKAISILTDGAGANQHLADYLDGLTKRVKGDAVSAESTSGVATIKHGSGIRVGAIAARTDKARTAASIRAESASSQPAGSSNTVASPTDADKHLAGNSHLTVGDMAFETNPAIEHW